MPTKEKVDAVWNKAKKVRGENPGDVRQDPYGNIPVRLHLAGAVLHSGRVELEPVGSGSGPTRH